MTITLSVSTIKTAATSSTVQTPHLLKSDSTDNEIILRANNNDISSSRLLEFEQSIASYIRDGKTVAIDCGKSPWFYISSVPFGNKNKRSLADAVIGGSFIDRVSELAGVKVEGIEDLRNVKDGFFTRSHIFVVIRAKAA